MPLDATDWHIGAHDRAAGGGLGLLIAAVALCAGVVLFTAVLTLLRAVP